MPQHNKLDISELTRAFWEHYQALFPKMSKAAKCILNASPSCSTIERFFSELVSMITPERNRMTADTIFERACTRHAQKFKTALDTLNIP